MAWVVRHDPLRYPLQVEGIHFALATVLPLAVVSL